MSAIVDDEYFWPELLSEIRRGEVCTVIGSELLSDVDGRSLDDAVARELLDLGRLRGPIEPGLEAAVLAIRADPRQDLARLLWRAIDRVQANWAAPACRQLSEISGLKLLVSLSPTSLLQRSLPNAAEYVHSMNQPGEQDLPGNWMTDGRRHLLYLFGKASPQPGYALNDEDRLEYIRNLIAGDGKKRPTQFLDAIRSRALLILGGGLPDWFLPFLLRATSGSKLSDQSRYCEWLIQQGTDNTGVRFLQLHSPKTIVCSDLPPARFLAELHARWLASEPQQTSSAATAPVHAPETLFFLSYSRGDLATVQVLREQLLQLGAGPHEIWFDQQEIGLGDPWREVILQGISRCRYFIPVISQNTEQRHDAYFRAEWREAHERRSRFFGSGERFILPILIDSPPLAPECYAKVPPDWRREIDFKAAPDGIPSPETRVQLQQLIELARSRG